MRSRTALKLKGDQAKQCGAIIKSLYEAFLAKDMSLLEINPLVVTKDGHVICLDAKINFDDNSLYRHKDILALRDLDEEDPMEVEASKYDLSYIKLDGSIGCMVNGAGLAMATMDIIKLCGEEPANFLDVGGGASKEKVTAAFKIIVSDPNVKGILVNIFGGIMKCDIIAEGIVAAAREISLSVPLVVRLEGTNVEKGKEILAKSGLPIVSGSDLADAAQKIVKAVKEKKMIRGSIFLAYGIILFVTPCVAASPTMPTDPLPHFMRAGAGFGCVMTAADHERMKERGDISVDIPCQRIGPLFVEMPRARNAGKSLWLTGCKSPNIPAGAAYKVYGLKSNESGALVTYVVVTYADNNLVDTIQVTGAPWSANWKFSGIGLGDTQDALLARFGEPKQKRTSDDPGAEVWSYLPWVFSFEVKNGVVSSIKVAVDHQHVTTSGAL